MAGQRRRGVVTRHPRQSSGSRDLGLALVRVLAVLGLGASAYLAYLHYSEATAALCAAGSGCDIVRSSSYSSIVGIPVAVLGLLGFAAILAVSFSGLSPFRKELSLLLLAAAGATFSGYLTYLELAVIDAVCPYCVASALSMVGILALLLLRRPLLPGVSTGSLGFYGGLVIVVVLAGAMIAYRGTDEALAQATPYQVALAKHLTDSGAVMYGAYWCPHCADQKRAFGDAFTYVDYAECDPAGQNARPELCKQKGITAYPTWELDGRLFEGVFSLQELAGLSGYGG